MKKTATLWLLIGLFSAVFLPWYAVESNFFTFRWLFFDFGSSDSASALIQSFSHDRWWLFSGVLPFLVAGGVLATINEHRKLARLLVLIAAIGLVMVVAQGFIIARTGPAMFVEALSNGAAATGQVGMGVGAMMVLASLLFMFTTGVSGMGKGRGDAFIVGLIGVSYIMAFNVPPIEITGTSIILIIVFVFRNMPVGVRGGIAALSQLDKSLDEASSTLGANSFTTVRKVIIPLMGPAMLAVLTYSFVRAITSVSAVIFLVSAKHNMATSFIVGRVENQDFGIAIAYATVLIFTMLAVILLMQLLIGKRKLRREDRVAAS